MDWLTVVVGCLGLLLAALAGYVTPRTLVRGKHYLLVCPLNAPPFLKGPYNSELVRNYAALRHRIDIKTNADELLKLEAGYDLSRVDTFQLSELANRPPFRVAK